MDKRAFLVGTFGTRGDIAPLLAISQMLLRMGHVVKFITHESYREICEKSGFTFYPLDDIPYIQKIHSRNKKDTKILMECIEEHFLKVIGDVDCIVSMGMFFSYASIADKYHKKYIQVMFSTQLISSGCYPPPMIEKQSRVFSVNRFLWFLYRLTVESMQLKHLNSCRTGIGLGSRLTDLEDYIARRAMIVNDSLLCPLPPDIPYKLMYVNYFYHRSIEDTDDITFLGENKDVKWAYIGFGSMNRHMKKYYSLYQMIQTLKKYHFKIVLNVNDLNIRTDNKNLLKILQEKDVIRVTHINHEMLFPKMSIIIHHGGVGTTYTACVSGVPQIVIPFYLDQFYWGRRVCELGIGECMSKYSKFCNRKFDKIFEKISQGRYNAAVEEVKAALVDNSRKEEFAHNFESLINQTFGADMLS